MKIYFDFVYRKTISIYFHFIFNQNEEKVNNFVTKMCRRERKEDKSGYKEKRKCDM